MRKIDIVSHCSDGSTSMNDLYALATRQRPDAELLLSTPARERDRRDARYAELLKSNPDWASLLELARIHGMLPSLFMTLDSLSWNHVPVHWRAEIEARFRRQAAHNLMLTGELLQIMDACEARGIRMLPVKGPILTQRLYGNVVQRSFLDLDLLVSFDDAEELCELLQERGYQSCLGVPASYQQTYFRFSRQLPLVATHGRAVEVHTALLNRGGASWTTFEALSRRAETMDFCGRSLPVLSREELLVFLCLHGEKHCWERLGWICDVAQLIKTHTQLDWSWIKVQTRKLHCEATVSLGLTLAHALFGSDVPDQWETTRGPHLESLARDVIANLPRSACERRRISAPFRRLSFQLKSAPLCRGRITYVWDTVMRPTLSDWRSMPLPSSFAALYFVLRPTRLLLRLVSRALGISQNAAAQEHPRGDDCRE